jgi:lipoate-protein ligase A
VQVSTCLVIAYENYNCFGEVSFFCHIEGFKMEQIAVNKFCVELQKTATETFEKFKSAYGEECLSGISASEWLESFKEERESLQDHEWKGCPSTSRTE